MHKKYNPHQLKQKGLTLNDQLRIKQYAKQCEREIEQQVFAKMILIPIMCLRDSHWEKSPKSKFEKFYNEMMKRYEDMGNQDFTIEDVKQYLKDEIGLEVEFKEE